MIERVIEERAAGDASRAAAIRAALVAQGPDDVVLVAGKGHEQGQVFASRTVDFDDRDEVRAAVAELAGGAA